MYLIQQGHFSWEIGIAVSASLVFTHLFNLLVSSCLSFVSCMHLQTHSFLLIFQFSGQGVFKLKHDSASNSIGICCNCSLFISNFVWISLFVLISLAEDLTNPVHHFKEPVLSLFIFGRTPVSWWGRGIEVTHDSYQD